MDAIRGVRKGCWYRRVWRKLGRDITSSSTALFSWIKVDMMYVISSVLSPPASFGNNLRKFDLPNTCLL